MSWRANIVNRLIEDLRRTQDGGGSRDSVAAPSNATSATDETPRPPKRPWEDMSRDEAPASNGNYPEVTRFVHTARTSADIHHSSHSPNTSMSQTKRLPKLTWKSFAASVRRAPVAMRLVNPRANIGREAYVNARSPISQALMLLSARYPSREMPFL